MTRVHQKMAVRSLSLIVMMLLMAGSVFEVSAQRRRRARSDSRTASNTVQKSASHFTLPAGTIIRVRMDTELNSPARVGSRFSTNVTEPVYGEGRKVVIQVGSKVRGRVQSVNRAGAITPSFYQIELPQGIYAINGSLTSLQADDVNADNESTVSDRGKSKGVVFIGGGAATGALIGVKLNRSVSLPVN